MQIKVVKLGNLGRTIGYIHRATLVKSGRVHNLGGVSHTRRLTNRVVYTLLYPRRVRRKR